MPLVDRLLVFLDDLIDVTSSHVFDEADFQVYLSLGFAVFSRERESRSHSPPSRRLVEEVSKAMIGFKASWELFTGLAMEEIWTTFRPQTARTLSQFETCIRIEGIADRFDSLKWRSGASLEELGKMRDSLFMVYTSVLEKNQKATETLNVGSLHSFRDVCC